MRAVSALPLERNTRLHMGPDARGTALAEATGASVVGLVVCGAVPPEFAGAIADLIAARPELRVVVVIDAAESVPAETLLASGVRAILPIDLVLTPERRANLLALALSGVDLVGPALLSTRARIAPPRPAPETPFAALPRRQREVASLIASGASNKQIARALSLSEATVKSHLMQTMRRLGFRSRLHLAIAAARAGSATG